jgi:hypothetical protein
MAYRSPFTRWVLVLVALWSAWQLIFGGVKWRTAPSLHWLQRVPVPLDFWGLMLVLYALLLLFARTRPAGFALGAALWSVFAVALIATINTSGPKNAIVIGALIDLAAFHIYAMKTAMAANDLTRLAQAAQL